MPHTGQPNSSKAVLNAEKERIAKMLGVKPSEVKITTKTSNFPGLNFGKDFHPKRGGSRRTRMHEKKRFATHKRR